MRWPLFLRLSVISHLLCAIVSDLSRERSQQIPTTALLELTDAIGHAHVVQTATDTLLAELKGTTGISSASAQDSVEVCNRFQDTVVSTLRSSCPDPADRAESWGAPYGTGGLFLDDYAPCVANNASDGEDIIGIGYDETAAVGAGVNTDIPGYEQLVRMSRQVGAVVSDLLRQRHRRSQMKYETNGSLSR